MQSSVSGDANDEEDKQKLKNTPRDSGTALGMEKVASNAENPVRPEIQTRQKVNFELLPFPQSYMPKEHNRKRSHKSEIVTGNVDVI